MLIRERLSGHYIAPPSCFLAFLMRDFTVQFSKGMTNTQSSSGCLLP